MFNEKESFTTLADVKASFEVAVNIEFEKFEFLVAINEANTQEEVKQVLVDYIDLLPDFNVEAPVVLDYIAYQLLEVRNSNEGTQEFASVEVLLYELESIIVHVEEETSSIEVVKAATEGIFCNCVVLQSPTIKQYIANFTRGIAAYYPSGLDNITGLEVGKIVLFLVKSSI